MSQADSILSLPNELLLVVAANLSLKDLNSFLRTSHRLNALLTPILQRLAVQDRGHSWWSPFPALHWAAWKGHTGLTKLLIASGFDVSLRSTFGGKTALHFAALMGNTEIVGLLLDAGADVDTKDVEPGVTALHVAALQGHEEVVKMLIKRGADVSVSDHTGRTPLVCVARYADVGEATEGVVRTLVESGADVDAGERECGRTCLHWAVEKGWKNVVKMLVNGGANLTVMDGKKETAIDWALKNGDDEMVGLLLEGAREREINGPILAMMGAMGIKLRMAMATAV